jgi:hypothetical protein
VALVVIGSVAYLKLRPEARRLVWPAPRAVPVEQSAA